MVAIPSGEKIIETKKCRISGREFIITDRDLEFYDTISPVFAGKKYLIPTPTLSPAERNRRRMTWRNNRWIYFSSIEKQLSMYNTNFWYISYQPKKYWSDEWSPFDYASDFDFSQMVFPQVHTLDKKVPKLARSIVNEENSDFANQAGHIKDCYLIFEAEASEKCYFGESCFHSKNCLDFLWAQYSEFCYEVVDCMRCYNVFYSQKCFDCKDSYFLSSCFDCKNCFWCINLFKKEYCFFNQQLTKEDYIKRMTEISFEKYLSAIKDKVNNFFKDQFFREHQNRKCENASWDMIFQSQNIYNSFDMIEVRDMKFCELMKWPTNNCYDMYSFGINSSFCYENTTVWFNANNVLFSVECWDSVTDLLYCMCCNKWVKNSFLCSGLKQKAEHCVMNKSYSVSEYETLCWRIIDHMRSTGEWWEFFPHELSPFGYNETVAQEYFPMIEEEVRSRGWNWYNAPEKTFEGSSALTPLTVSDYDEKIVWFEVAQRNIDTLLQWVIKCEVTGKPFKIIKQELAFYIENKLPIPTKHPDQRHVERMNMRNPRELHERNCAECGISITTTYAPNRTEKIVCEECYRKLVY